MTAPQANKENNRSLFGQELFGQLKGSRASFEFFPPATEKMTETLWNSIEVLAPIEPSFVSVTYGAGGSTRDRTHDVIKRLLAETNMPPAAHLTCVGATRAEVDNVVDDYYATGVRHIVALRGDAPDGAESYTPHPGGYENAQDLVAGIAKRYSDIDISVAAYPEKHPDSPSLVHDLDNLKRKIDAGATQAITQFFFDPDAYFRFRDHCESYGITVPIIPGILPVTNFKTVKRFAAQCGAGIPPWMEDLFADLDDRPQTRNLVAATTTAELCHRLGLGGVEDFHFYTLNRAELTYAVCHILGLRPHQKA